MVPVLPSSCPVWVLMFAGITVRWTAIHALGVFFNGGRVQIREGHTLIRTGLYSRLRHPAYAGSLLAYFGLGLALSNWWTLACSLLPYLIADPAIGFTLRRRSFRRRSVRAYAQYARATKRIVPWVVPEDQSPESPITEPFCSPV